MANIRRMRCPKGPGCALLRRMTGSVPCAHQAEHEEVVDAYRNRCACRPENVWNTPCEDPEGQCVPLGDEG